jgi:putative selenium metabolism hydrolase
VYTAYENDLIGFAQQIIRTPSTVGDESAVAKIIAAKMTEFGYDQVSIDDKNSVIGRLVGSGEGKNLILNGHIDTVDPGEMENPYNAEIINGKDFGYESDVISGRGSCDMKGAIAAIVYTGGFIKRQGLKLKGDVWVICNSLEENTGGEGILHILENNNLHADMAIVAEPSNFNIHIGQTGRIDFKIITKGKTCHSAFPEKGKNAIYAMSHFLQVFQKHYQIDPHPDLGNLTYTVLEISSPSSIGLVPDQCQIILTRRTNPEETQKSIENGIKEIFESVRKEDPSFEAEIICMGEKMLGFYCPPSEEIVKTIKEASKNVMNTKPPISILNAGTEAGFLMKYGIPSVIFGPGHTNVAHTSYEFVPVDQLITAFKVYTKLIRIINEI